MKLKTITEPCTFLTEKGNICVESTITDKVPKSTTGFVVLPWILMRAVQTGSHEIFTLCVIAIAIGIAESRGGLAGIAAGGVMVGGVIQHLLAHRKSL